MEIQVGSILAQILNFGILTAVLTFFLLKPIKSVLETRSRRIAEGQKAAEEALAEKAHIGEMKAQAEKEAKQQAKNLIAAARTEAEDRKVELLSANKAEVEAAREAMMKAVEKEKAALLKTWQDQLETVVLEVAEQVVGESLDAKKHSKLISQAFKRIEASK